MEPGTKSTVATVLAIAGAVGSATAYLHVHVNTQVAGLRTELTGRTRDLDTKMQGLDSKVNTLIRDVGRLEGLVQGLHGIKVISDEPSLSGPEHVAKPEKHQ